ncbi:MAG: hypothetical protein WKF58_18575 [Ilumatobacteraceae bacterium]
MATVELVMPCERLRWLCPARAMDADEVQRLLAAMPSVGLLCCVDSRLVGDRSHHRTGARRRSRTSTSSSVVEPSSWRCTRRLGDAGSVALTELVTGTVLSQHGVVEPVGTAAQYPPTGGCASTPPASEFA